jgi:predicted nucleic acid-binding protein
MEILTSKPFKNIGHRGAAGHAPENTLSSFQKALELGADLVLLDEQAGRFAAQYFNLKVIGVVGLLVKAKNNGIITEVRPLLDALRWQAGFYLSEPVYRHALALSGE